MLDPCPKCGYESRAGDGPRVGECPRCGVVFAKWRARVAAEEHLSEGEAGAPAPPWIESVEDEVEPSLAARLLRSPFTVKPKIGTLEFYGHVVVFVFFAVWGWRFILMDMHTNEIGGSFMHLVNLVFHEAGHVLFVPFGRFMTILGGSLNQLLVPLVVTVAFLVKNRDPFGASIGLWWLGQSFKDLAPYINDARALALPLLGGITGIEDPGVHDWRNILGTFGILHLDHVVARASNRTGTALILLSMVWGAYVLFREYRTVDDEL